MSVPLNHHWLIWYTHCNANHEQPLWVPTALVYYSQFYDIGVIIIHILQVKIKA